MPQNVTIDTDISFIKNQCLLQEHRPTEMKSNQYFSQQEEKMNESRQQIENPYGFDQKAV